MEKLLPNVRKVIVEKAGSPVLPLLPLGGWGESGPTESGTKPPAPVRKEREK
jgi:hypothetical protein